MSLCNVVKWNWIWFHFNEKLKILKRLDSISWRKQGRKKKSQIRTPSDLVWTKLRQSFRSKKVRDEEMNKTKKKKKINDEIRWYGLEISYWKKSWWERGEIRVLEKCRDNGAEEVEDSGRRRRLQLLQIQTSGYI